MSVQAVSRSNEKCIKELVRLSADISAKDNLNKSPQDLASESNNINLGDLLVQREVSLKRIKNKFEIALYLYIVRHFLLWLGVTLSI